MAKVTPGSATAAKPANLPRDAVQLLAGPAADDTLPSCLPSAGVEPTTGHVPMAMAPAFARMPLELMGDARIAMQSWPIWPCQVATNAHAPWDRGACVHAGVVSGVNVPSDADHLSQLLNCPTMARASTQISSGSAAMQALSKAAVRRCKRRRALDKISQSYTTMIGAPPGSVADAETTLGYAHTCAAGYPCAAAGETTQLAIWTSGHAAVECSLELSTPQRITEAQVQLPQDPLLQGAPALPGSETVVEGQEMAATLVVEQGLTSGAALTLIWISPLAFKPNAACLKTRLQSLGCQVKAYKCHQKALRALEKKSHLKRTVVLIPDAEASAFLKYMIPGLSSGMCASSWRHPRKGFSGGSTRNARSSRTSMRR